MVAPRILPRTNLLLQPKLQHVGVSTSSLTSTHSCRSIMKNPVYAEDAAAAAAASARPVNRRVHFSDSMEQSVLSYALEFSDNSTSSCDSMADGVTVEVREFDPCIDATNAPLLFFTLDEIDHMRTDARRQANRFAVDYPDYVVTLERLYHHGATATMADLESVRKELRHRRKRKHAMAIALKWSILDDDSNDEEDYVFDHYGNEVAPSPVEVDYYASAQENDELDNEVFCHVDMRGLEIRVTPTFRLHRKLAIDAVLHLQREMKRAGCCPAQIEMGLRAKAVQFSNRAKQFAVHQAQLDSTELVL